MRISQIWWRLHAQICLGLALLFLLASARPAWCDAPLEGTSPAQWRVVWTEDPATTALVAWNTADEGSTHHVQIGVRGQEERRRVTCQRSGRYSGDPVLFFHHVTIDNLEPETEYELVMISDGNESPVMYFKTAPSDGRPLSILFGGDSRSGRSSRRQMNSRMAEMVANGTANENEAEEIFALAHGGDYVVSGRSLQQWSDWMSDYEVTVAADGRMLPIIPARGNHDAGPIFNQFFGFEEEETDSYFAIDIGPSLRFITLNTEISIAGDQQTWLDTELQESRPTHTWVLAQYHRPAYPAIKRPSGALNSWVPLFEQYNVDLVCEADGHCIKRTLPIRDGRPDETGVVYVGEGGLGVEQRSPDAERWYLQAPGMVSRGHHVQWLTFSSNELRYRCVRLGGEIADTYTREPRSRE